ncbi:MAG TPA: alkaline phosphatase family protein, partial [Roseiarcus sp.]
MTTPDHIVLVSLENENFSDIVGNIADAPFLNQLISDGMLFTNYNGLTHPSQANYIALFSGSTQGVTGNGAIPQFPASVPTLDSALAVKGLTFGGYAETDSTIERQPWDHFANSIADSHSMSAFPQTAAGFANLPTVSFITPNDQDNMTPTSDSGGGIPKGDAWVQANLSAYAAWAQANNSLLIITFDENNTNPAVTYPDHIVTIVVGAGVPAGVTNSSQADTYSLLNTIQSLYGLTPVGVSAGAPPLDFYSATPHTATSSVTTSFSGISDPNNYPPENALAVGPQFVLTAESVPYEVTDLSGGAAITKSQFQLFSSLGPILDNSVFDTRAAYDSSTGRYVMIANNLQPGGTSTNIDIAVSRDSNPADGWYVGSIDTSQGGTVQSDMPYLSVSNGNIYITAPNYSNGPFVGTGEWVVSENSVISGSTQVAASNTTPASDAIMRGVAGANGKTYYLGAYSDARETALTYQTYDPANGFSATQTLFLGTSDVGGGGNDFTAAQLGTNLTLDAGDSRVQSLAYASSGGRNYIYGVSESMPSAGSLTQIEWFKLDVTDPANPQFVNGNVITGASIGANVAVFNASIGVDGNGDVLINFTASGPNMNPSDYY